MTRPGRPLLGSTTEPLEVPVMTRLTASVAARARATLAERETMADLAREAIVRETERREARGRHIGRGPRAPMGVQPPWCSDAAWSEASAEFARVVAKVRDANPDAPDGWLAEMEATAARGAFDLAMRLTVEGSAT